MPTNLHRILRGVVVMLTLIGASVGQIGVVVSFAPPPLPVYVQPPCPAEGYLWAPGYWAYDPDFGDYYWVPGTWVLAPEAGLFWTPGWWGWGGEGFIFHTGYWGPQVGFYGGVNYGYGYFGEGYQGGRWDHGHFYYNRAVNNVNVMNIHNVYNTTVVNDTRVTRVSYNGGNGGIDARPTAAQEAAEREKHIPPVSAQTQQVQMARTNPQLRASVNQGKPPIAATPKSGAFHDREAVPAVQAGGAYTPAGNRAAAEPKGAAPSERPEGDVPRPSAAVHPNDLPPAAPPPAPNTGNAKLDQKYQQQQEKLRAQQDEQRQQLQQQQDREHQQLAQQKADQAKKQQVEQQHQQQTQHLQQQQARQQQQLQSKQQPLHKNQPPPPKEKP